MAQGPGRPSDPTPVVHQQSIQAVIIQPRASTVHGMATHTAGVAPADVTKAAAAEGTSVAVARADHKHDISTAAAGASAVGDTAAEGTATSLARSDHRHSREAFATPAIVLGSAAAAGVATTPIRSDSTIAAFDATAPTTSGVGDAAAVGSVAFAARRDHRHGREAFATNTFAYSTATAAGVATTLVRSDATLAIFDATVPVTQASADVAATGSAAIAARRDHKHGMPTIGSAPISRYKTVSESVNNSTTLQNDDDFTFSIGASEVWLVKIRASASLPPASDFKFSFAGPVGMVFTALLFLYTGSAMSVAKSPVRDAQGNATAQVYAATQVALEIWATIINSTTAGTVNFQFAQNTAVVEDTTLQQDSHMVATKV